MTDNVVEWGGITKLDMPADRVLNGALKAGLKTAIVVGIREDGKFYFASNKADGGETLWWLALAQKKLLDIGDSSDD